MMNHFLYLVGNFKSYIRRRIIKNRPEIELIEMKGMNHHLEIEELEIVAQKMIEKLELDKI